MCQVKISKFLGRSGNNWLQLVNVIYYAFTVKNCAKVVFPEQPLLTVTEINNPSSGYCQCSKVVTDRHNFFFSHYFGVSKIPIRIMRDLAQQYLVPHLRDLNLDANEKLNHRHLLIHIRSGDTFKRRPHGHYYPPPLDYYRQLIREYETSTIVYENEQNPCIQRLKAEFPDIKFQSSTLTEDLQTLCQASHLAIGYGSFGLLLYLLSKRLERLYIPSYLEHDTFLYQFNWGDHGLEKLVSVDLDKYREKMGARWQGSPGQIKLMLNWGSSEPDNGQGGAETVSPPKRVQPVKPVNRIVATRQTPIPAPSAKIIRQVLRPLGDYQLIHYCFDRFPNNFGGVARFDYHLGIAFPNRVFIKSGDKAGLLRAIRSVGRVVVVTDNQCVTDVPSDCPAVIVHHGVARATIERNPELGRKSFYRDILKRQDQMLDQRDPDNTLMLSPSQYCLDLFQHYYGDRYTRFPQRLLGHASELDPNQHKSEFNSKPVILGNFSNDNKGIHMLHKLQKALPEFEIKRLYTRKRANINLHNAELSNIYLSADIFLQLSGSEGFGYATLDAFNKGLLVCGTDVGLLYDLKSSDVAQVFSYQLRNNAEQVAQQVRELWASRDTYTGRSHRWYLKNSGLDRWCNNIQEIIGDFLNTLL